MTNTNDTTGTRSIEVAHAQESRCKRHNAEGCRDCVAKVFWGKAHKDATGRLFYAADLGGRSWRIERLEKAELHWPGHSYTGCSYGYMLYESLGDDGNARPILKLRAADHSIQIVLSLEDAHSTVRRILKQAAQRVAQAEALAREQAAKRAHVEHFGGLDGARTALPTLEQDVVQHQAEYDRIGHALQTARVARDKLRDAVAFIVRDQHVLALRHYSRDAIVSQASQDGLGISRKDHETIGQALQRAGVWS